MDRYVKVDDVMELINTSNRGNCDYFIVDQIEELCASQKTITEAEIRAKAIEEFAEKLKENVTLHYVDCDGHFGGIEEEILYAEYIDEIATELKGEC